MALITMKDIENISPVFKGKFGNELARLRLPHEILNKEGKTVRLGIGEVISVEEQMHIPKEDFAAMLRSSVYGIIESNKNKRYECHD